MNKVMKLNLSSPPLRKEGNIQVTCQLKKSYNLQRKAYNLQNIPAQIPVFHQIR